MGEVVNLQPEHLEENHGFIQDCCRFQEGILTQENMKLKYRSFTEDVWQKLGDDTMLLEAVEEEKIRRVRTGASKRERAQGLIVKGPAILDSIAADVSNSPRHRVDALKVLNDFAANPSENSPAAAGYFQISINLGADVDGTPIVERYTKSITISPDNSRDSAVAAPLPATNKWDDSNDVVATAPAQMELFRDKPASAARAASSTTTRAPKKREISAVEAALESLMRF